MSKYDESGHFSVRSHVYMLCRQNEFHPRSARRCDSKSDGHHSVADTADENGDSGHLILPATHRVWNEHSATSHTETSELGAIYVFPLSLCNVFEKMVTR